MPDFSYAIHDPGGEHLMPAGSWIVFTEAIGCDPNDQSGKDYRGYAARGYNVIVRLNNGYAPAGTIPEPEHYGIFAKRCANFVRNSPGATRWIIGNEPNHAQEWPNGHRIFAADYARCFVLCADAIHLVDRNHQVLVAGVAPWNVQVGDWLAYQETMLRQIGAKCDGITLHTYTHGVDPNLVFSEAKMNPPFEDRHFHFRAYRDMLAQVPLAMRWLPVYITETDQDDPWADVNSGWVKNAYREIDDWNRTPGAQKIRCLALYRWPNHDKWGFENKKGVQDDLRDAVNFGYRSPDLSESTPSFGVPSPVPPAPVPPAGVPSPQPSLPTAPVSPPQVGSAPPPIWDPRLDALGVTWEPANVTPGHQYWRLVEARWRNVEQSEGRHHIYMSVVDEQGERIIGQPITVSWDGDSATVRVENKPPDEMPANFAMYSPGNAYDAVPANLPGDIVQGMGLGTIEERHYGHHVCYDLFWARSTATLAPEIPVSPEAPISPSLPVTPIVPVLPGVPPVSGDECWARALQFVIDHEGGWADNPADPGGATMRGVTIGTYTKWRQSRGLPAPTKEDLRNISTAEVEEIYKKWYWDPIDGDSLPWPLCLAAFDLSVNAGPERAKEYLAKADGNFIKFMADTIHWYTRISNFEHFGKAWIRRRADVLLEAAE